MPQNKFDDHYDAEAASMRLLAIIVALSCGVGITWLAANKPEPGDNQTDYVYYVFGLVVTVCLGIALMAILYYISIDYKYGSLWNPDATPDKEDKIVIRVEDKKEPKLLNPPSLKKANPTKKPVKYNNNKHGCNEESCCDCD